MKKELLYGICKDNTGWIMVFSISNYQKTKKGYYYYADTIKINDYPITSQFVFPNGASRGLFDIAEEGIHWWRTYEAANKAKNLRLRDMYLTKKNAPKRNYRSFDHIERDADMDFDMSTYE